MRSWKKNQKGFTLAEEVITVLLVSILVVSATGIIMNAIRIFSMNVISLNAQAKGIAVMDELTDNLTYANKISTASNKDNFSDDDTDKTNSYQMILYSGSDSTTGKKYLYGNTKVKNTSTDTWSSISSADNKLCDLGSFDVSYQISVTGDYAVIDLKVNRSSKTWYSEKRTIALKNHPPVDGFTYDSTAGGYLYISSIE